MLIENREHHGEAGPVDAGRRTPGALLRGLGHQRLHLGEERAASLDRHRDAGAGDPAVVALDEEAGGVGDRGDAVGPEVEAADLVGRAEPVLDRTDHAQPAAGLALEAEHHVDEVLEHAGTGDRAVLGDVSDQHHGDAAGLGEPGQRGGDLLDLGDAARHALDARGADGLHGVDDQQRAGRPRCG